MPITKEYITLNIEDIIPYENNPRINDDAVAGVVESIKQCGELDPIEVDENNIILSGHTRLLAYKKLEYKQVSVLKITGLTEPQKRKYRLLTNKTGEVAGWDFDKLELELDGLDFDGFDFGFDVDLPSLEEDDQKEVVEDDYDEEPPTEPKAKLGDLYILGNHHLICGDSTDPAVIDRLMDGVKANMVFTDPPYGYNYQSNMRTKSEKFDVLENDDKILNFFPNLLGRVKGFVMICTTWKVLDKWLPLFKQYFELSNMVIWDKGGGGIGDLKHTFSTDYEVILCANNGEEIREKRIGSVWSIGKDNANDYEHPTQKPVELSANAIRHTTDKQQIVLDCFGGSGSTLIACEQLNRKCYMAELDPKYVSVIVNRWLNLTGRKDEIFCIRDGQKLTYDEVFN